MFNEDERFQGTEYTSHSIGSRFSTQHCAAYFCYMYLFIRRVRSVFSWLLVCMAWTLDSVSVYQRISMGVSLSVYEYEPVYLLNL